MLALTSVNGSSAACAASGDEETVVVLREYYALVAAAVARAGGDVVKVMGDGVLVTFPVERVRDAVEALRSAQSEGTRLWAAFDPRCRIVVRVGAGAVVTLPLGPPGAERPDVYGDALNRLMKMPPDDFTTTAEIEALLT